jgi:glycogen phosphorylase
MTAGAAELTARAELLAERLDEDLRPLARVAYNFRWSWSRDGESVFRDLDAHGWRLSGRNPVVFLQRLAVGRHTVRSDELRARIERLADELDEDLGRPDATVDGIDGPIAFFCAEFGVHSSLPTYSGGLGVLAGDVLKEASDRALPMVGVGLLYRRGYFRQRLDETGWQQEFWPVTDPDTLPAALVTNGDGEPLKLSVGLFGQDVTFQAWRVDVGRVPLFLLDCELPENDPVQQWTTSRLYDGNRQVRLAQYGVLGLGGASLLEALGIEPAVIHLNEGHPVLAVLQFAADDVANGMPLDEALARVRARTVFTTHTPVPAGNETYEPDEFLAAFGDVAHRLGLTDEEFLAFARVNPEDPGDPPGMSSLAMRVSRARNGVSRLHGDVARKMWQPLFGTPEAENVPITHVTNGAHLRTFLSRPFRELFERHLGDNWLEHTADPESWARVREVPNGDLWQARCDARAELIRFARAKAQRDRLLRGEQIEYARAIGERLSPDALTLGFARRIATYKRAGLLIRDEERARRILGGDPPVQLLISGKAHPRDRDGKTLLQRLYGIRRSIPELAGRVAFLEDYDLQVGRRLVAGCDVWVNLPRKPMEASGTSGMKAAFNGALQLSVLDGWWAEAYNGSNGWGIPGSEDEDAELADTEDANEFYALLENEVIPTFYDRDENGVPHRWCELMKESLATCAPQFNTVRMLDDYVERIWRT